MSLLLLFWFVCAISAALIFQNKNLSPIAGAVLGFVLGPIGVLIAACVRKEEKK